MSHKYKTRRNETCRKRVSFFFFYGAPRNAAPVFILGTSFRLVSGLVYESRSSKPN